MDARLHVPSAYEAALLGTVFLELRSQLAGGNFPEPPCAKHLAEHARHVPPHHLASSAPLPLLLQSVKGFQADDAQNVLDFGLV